MDSNAQEQFISDDATPSLPQEVEEVLARHVRPQTCPKQGELPGVTLAGVAEIAQILGATPREAMIMLLRAGIWPMRFVRNCSVISCKEQATLLSSGAAIIGCGGLGGHVAALLARMGLGELTLCDYRDFDETDLNRQQGAYETNMGENKAAALGKEVRAIASHVAVNVFAEPASQETLPSILHGANIVVDCLDSLEVRLMVEKAAHALSLSFVHASMVGEEGFVLMSRPGSTTLQTIFGNTVPQSRNHGTGGAPTPTAVGVAMLAVRLTARELLGKLGAGAILRHLDLDEMRIESLKM